MSETTEVWGRWDEDGPFFVRAEGLTLEQAAEALWLELEFAGYEMDESRVYPEEGEQPRMELVHDCDWEGPKPCSDPDCRHGHEELVYKFWVGDAE